MEKKFVVLIEFFGKNVVISYTDDLDKKIAELCKLVTDDEMLMECAILPNTLKVRTMLSSNNFSSISQMGDIFNICIFHSYGKYRTKLKYGYSHIILFVRSDGDSGFNHFFPTKKEMEKKLQELLKRDDYKEIYVGTSYKLFAYNLTKDFFANNKKYDLTKAEICELKNYIPKRCVDYDVYERR